MRKALSDGRFGRLYYESQCPFCRNTITASFAEAMRAEGFLRMANVSLFPYGNAEETKTASGWSFPCQHGPSECQYNLLEACATKLVTNFSQQFAFIVRFSNGLSSRYRLTQTARCQQNCVENNNTASSAYTQLAKACAAQARLGSLLTGQILACFQVWAAPIFCARFPFSFSENRFLLAGRGRGAIRARDCSEDGRSKPAAPVRALDPDRWET